MKWSGKLNKKYTLISAYVIVTAVIIYILSMVVNSAPIIVAIVLDRLGWLVTVIKPVIIGFVIAYLLDPVIRFFEERLLRLKLYKKRPKRARLHSVLITVSLALVFLAALISILVYTITNQVKWADFQDIGNLIKQFVIDFDAFFKSVSMFLSELDIETKEIQNLIIKITNYVSNVVTNTVSSTAGSIGNVTGVLTTLAFSIIIGIWFMIDGAFITRYLNKIMYALFNQKTNDRVHRFFHDADDVFSGYIRGQLLDALVMMCLISVSLSLVGVKFAVVIGVLAGFGNLIPYLGPFVAYASTVVVCVLRGEYKILLIAVIILAIIQVIDGNLIGPKLLSKSISVHPLLVIVSLIFGSAIGGFLGMLLAVPVGALIMLLFVRFIDARVEKKNLELGYMKGQEEEITKENGN